MSSSSVLRRWTARFHAASSIICVDPWLLSIEARYRPSENPLLRLLLRNCVDVLTLCWGAALNGPRLTVADFTAVTNPDEDHEDDFWCLLAPLFWVSPSLAGSNSSKSSNDQRSRRGMSALLRCEFLRRSVVTHLLNGCVTSVVVLVIRFDGFVDKVSTLVASNDRLWSIFSESSSFCSSLFTASRSTSSSGPSLRRSAEVPPCRGGTGISLPQLDLCDIRCDAVLAGSEFSELPRKCIVEGDAGNGIVFAFLTRSGPEVYRPSESTEFRDESRLGIWWTVSDDAYDAFMKRSFDEIWRRFSWSWEDNDGK